jgi:hypothetical protein
VALIHRGAGVDHSPDEESFFSRIHKDQTANDFAVFFTKQASLVSTVERNKLENAKAYPEMEWTQRRQLWLDNLNSSVAELEGQL